MSFPPCSQDCLAICVVSGDGLCLFHSDFLPLLGGKFLLADVGFYCVELLEHAEGMGRVGELFPSLEELPPGVGHAAEQDDALGVLELVVAFVTVGQEVALEVFQVSPRPTHLPRKEFGPDPCVMEKEMQIPRSECGDFYKSSKKLDEVLSIIFSRLLIEGDRLSIESFAPKD